MCKQNRLKKMYTILLNVKDEKNNEALVGTLNSREKKT